MHMSIVSGDCVRGVKKKGIRFNSTVHLRKWVGKMGKAQRGLEQKAVDRKTDPNADTEHAIC